MLKKVAGDGAALYQHLGPLDAEVDGITGLLACATVWVSATSSTVRRRQIALDGDETSPPAPTKS